MTDRNLSDEIKAWIETSGRALELRTARTLATRLGPAAKVQLGVFYRDTAEGKYREADVVASMENPRSPGRIIKVVVETKATRDGAWIVLTDSRRYVHDDEARDRALLYWGGSIDVNEAWRGIRGTPCVPTNAPGYTILNALKDRTNSAYDAVRQVTSAASHLMSVLPGGAPQASYCQLTIPVVITTEPLYEGWLDENGAVQVVETQHTSLYVQPDLPRPPTPVQVMTEEFFSTGWVGEIPYTVDLLR